MGAIGDIIRRHASAYVQQFGKNMPPGHKRVLRDLARCRTPDAGGQQWLCPKCGQTHTACHSCGNRHCPTCGGDDAKAWLDRQLALQLPVSYFLCTFTVPQELRQIISSSPKEQLSLLFQTASSSLLDLCLNSKWFGATPGITAMLHTWTRAMAYHPHIHFLVTGGGFTPSGNWIPPKSGFLVPSHALSSVFRARFKTGLQSLDPVAFKTIPKKVWATDWVVDIENVGNGEHALKYLARYIYRVAISDSAIVHHDDPSASSPNDSEQARQATVTFRYRDSDTGNEHTMTLPVFKFIHRFLQHVLPKGFVKVRYYALHHPAHRKTLALARAQLYLQLNQPIPPPPPTTPKPPMLCPLCKTQLVPDRRFNPGELPPRTGPP